MSTTNAYDVWYHYEVSGKLSGAHDHIQVAASASDYATISAAVKNSTQYKAGQGTLVIDRVSQIGGGALQQ